MRRTLFVISILLTCGWAAAADASWLSKLLSAAETAGGRAVRHGGGSLDGAAAHIKTLPRTSDGHALAAAATPEGHWRFVNAAGETITVASPEEMRRALAILTGEGTPGGKLALYLSEDTAFRQRALLKELPDGADLHVLVGGRPYRLLRRLDAAGDRSYVEVRPNLLVDFGDRRMFEEAMFQLSRRLNKANIRVIALEPGGPGLIPRAPRLDPTSGRTMTDAVDPERLLHTLSTIRGQTALISGRLEGELLHFKPARGNDGSLPLRELTAAAEAADVNLVVVNSASPRQPGARNWLWQRVEVRGLEAALERPTLADFFDALGGPEGPMAVSATPGPLRSRLDVRPALDQAGAPTSAPIAGVVSEIVSDIAGQIVTTGIQASVRSAERQRELDRRILPGVPSDLQFGYMALFVLGLFGLPVARGWWQRLWPTERREEYGSAFGYVAARTVRGTLMLIFFVPLVAPASAPVQAVRSLLGVVVTAWNLLILSCRAVAWPFRRLFGAARA